MSAPFSDPPRHGQIVGGLSVTPDLDAAICDYRDVLGLELVETGLLDGDLAAAWHAPASAGARIAVLRPRSGAPCALRLVEQPDCPGFVPTTSHGWAAFELTVQNVFGWPDRLKGSGFAIQGLPRELEGMAYFVPMQVLGRGREMVYLNEVRADMPNCDLPRAGSPVDHLFIAILATPDRSATVEWYERRLGLQATDTFTLTYKMINNAFGLPDDYRTDLTMVQEGRMTIFEVDGYPTQATARPRHERMLPPGNALVSIAVTNLDALDVEWLTPPAAHGGFLYHGRHAATLRGPGGELLECIEHG
ncbi:MAG: VOC family protein [Novosphingobium sp.]|jgi:catechol 2,3-dioxygenase-like lactoylglutathione lyase family enzyme|nr:VOC family protein [Novosphingobium sp.]